MEDEDDGLMLNFTGLDTETPLPTSRKTSKKERRVAQLKQRRNKQKQGSARHHAPAQPQQRPQKSGAVDTPGRPAKQAPCDSGRTDAAAPAVDSDGEAENDILAAAVAASMARDSAAAAALAAARQPDGNVASDDEAEAGGDDDDDDLQGGTVSFPTGKNGLRAQQKKRLKAQQQGDTKSKGEAKTYVRHKQGELVHTGGQVPAAQQLEVFGPVDSTTFHGLGLAQSLAEHLEAINFTTPTRVQRAAIPVLLKGRDALVNAPTGSGKTLAFLAPIVHDLQAQFPRLNRADGTYAIIIAPTRELCMQICDVLTLMLRRYVWLVGGSILGGENRNKEKARLRKGVTVVVASPGRLLDHLQNTEAFHTQELRWLVLDEADRLLDLGFEQKIAEMVDILDRRTGEAGTRRRQTALFSATLHSNLGQLATLSLHNPASVGFSAQLINGQLTVSGATVITSAATDKPAAKAGGDEDGAAAQPGADRQAVAEEAAPEQFNIPTQLRQRYYEVPCKLRLAALAALIRSQCHPSKLCKLVVFMSSCDGVEFHHRLFTQLYHEATGLPLVTCPIFKLHGNLEQAARTRTFLDFVHCKTGVLLCTDVAARGLDFPSVSCILQYDPPGEPAEYVHRVGRTARLGQQGEAFLFLMPQERDYISLLQDHNVSIASADLLPLLKWLPAPKKPSQGARQGENAAERHEGAFALQSMLANAVSQDLKMKQMGGDAFRSYVRSYAIHPASLKPIFHVRKLHLGHVAYSFALKDTPTMIGQSGTKMEKRKRKADVAMRAKNKRSKRV
ncbi:hypothetical protein WJX72_009018 [[Myrmecia] bisecta]|uniref:ATP-dependent RNA helicase n=1 Tax=[Myrmecia] bisecta TaxID=41462 RepID=A0AAW1Q423_9CHLO